MSKKPDSTATAVPRRYHVVLTSGAERTVTAQEVQVSAIGALIFEGEAGVATTAFAPGSWTFVELETRDE
jgi:hypothetical protein